MSTNQPATYRNAIPCTVISAGTIHQNGAIAPKMIVDMGDGAILVLRGAACADITIGAAS
jgi:hypothetical protein